jgi:hypothetical protein
VQALCLVPQIAVYNAYACNVCVEYSRSFHLLVFSGAIRSDTKMLCMSDQAVKVHRLHYEERPLTLYL